jgi:uncharacterized membrane protein YeaQ/YmgE (transglycosylase-associated protein family)
MRSSSAIYRFGVILLSLLAAAAIGWIAFQLQQQKALPGFLFPLLFPLLTGAATGATCAALFRRAPSSSTTHLLAAAAGGLIAVAVEVLTGYQYYVAAVERQLHGHPMAVLAHSANDDFSPASLAQFITARVRGSGGWWIADAVLTVAGSVATCWIGLATRSASSQANPPNTE